MKQIVFIIMILCFTSVLFADNDLTEYKRIRLSSIGIKTDIPADWTLVDSSAGQCTYTNSQGDAHYIFSKRYEYDYSGTSGYNDFTDENKDEVIENGEYSLIETRPEFEFTFLYNEFIELGNKTFYHIQHEAFLKPEYYYDDEYDEYPELFCEDMYFYLNYGYFYSFQIYMESEISNDEIKTAKYVMEHLELL